MEKPPAKVSHGGMLSQIQRAFRRGRDHDPPSPAVLIHDPAPAELFFETLYLFGIAAPFKPE